MYQGRHSVSGAFCYQSHILAQGCNKALWFWESPFKTGCRNSQRPSRVKVVCFMNATLRGGQKKSQSPPRLSEYFNLTQ